MTAFFIFTAIVGVILAVVVFAITIEIAPGSSGWVLESWEDRGHDWVLTVRDGQRTLQFIGNCTVWFSYPSMRRQNTATEGRLLELYRQAKHQQWQAKTGSGY